MRSRHLHSLHGPRRRGGGIRSSFYLVLFVALVVFVVLALRSGTTPTVTIKPGLSAVGQSTPIAIEVHESVRGIVSLKVVAIQNDIQVTLHDETFEPRPVWAFWGPMEESISLEVIVGKKTISNLRAGELTVQVVAAGASSLLRPSPTSTEELVLPVKLQPPRLAPLSPHVFAEQGGSEVVVYSVDDTAIKHGVQSGAYFFPGYPLKGRPGEYFSLFAVPYDLEDESAVNLIAEDEVGNATRMSFIEQFRKNPLSTDKINVSTSFMQKVVPRILAKTPDFPDRGSLLDNYIAVNSQMREINNERILTVGRRVIQRFYWNKRFIQMPSKVVSNFADRRTYLFENKKIDQQDHLGYDLASTSKATIPSANDGKVVMVEYLGIYGNTVIVDHGYGLQTLYAHMSSFAVKVGDEVKRGQALGRTGATGLALGDHLHFAVMIQGLPVEPKQWWDGHWIHDRIALKLGDALNFEKQAAQPKPKKRRRKRRR